MARLLTMARDLRRRKARERKGRFVAEGVRAVEELLASALTVDGALVEPSVRDTPRGARLFAQLVERGILVEEVAADDFHSAADTEQPQGILAIAAVPTLTLEQVELGSSVGRLLVLDGVQDPGNVGTLLRTAAALGVQAVVALPGTADLWNAKAVRSAVGAHFRIAAVHADVGALRTALERLDAELWATAADGEPIDTTVPPERLAIAVGNEGAGVSAEVRALATRVVSLPMTAGVESLNVAVAAGITLYALRAGSVG